ncbi:hypothetical protein I3U54_26230 [Mycobacteroides abscessus subsp. abscessus]|nr:hypothetical protein [Mycobacteroides abscessus subsp. abscessus]
MSGVLSVGQVRHMPHLEAGWGSCGVLVVAAHSGVQRCPVLAVHPVAAVAARAGLGECGGFLALGGGVFGAGQLVAFMIQTGIPAVRASGWVRDVEVLGAARPVGADALGFAVNCCQGSGWGPVRCR